VTSLATTPEDPNLLLSSSRDKSVIVWQLTHSSTMGEDDSYGYARRALRGHSHFVSDVVISSDGAFALSASWDSELRLWDIGTGKTTRRFVGHEKDVLSVAFSVDNRQIVSGTYCLFLSLFWFVALMNTFLTSVFDLTLETNRCSRRNDSSLEYSRRVQVHHQRRFGGTHGVGILRTILTLSASSVDC